MDVKYRSEGDYSGNVSEQQYMMASTIDCQMDYYTVHLNNSDDELHDSSGICHTIQWNKSLHSIFKDHSVMDCDLDDSDDGELHYSSGICQTICNLIHNSHR